MTSPFRDELESLRRENAELRAQLSRSRRPRPFVAFALAGGGVVADSDPAAELAETEVKLEALLPVLSG